MLPSPEKGVFLHRRPRPGVGRSKAGMSRCKSPISEVGTDYEPEPNDESDEDEASDSSHLSDTEMAEIMEKPTKKKSKVF